MDADRLRYLIDRYVSGSCTRQEMDELLDYVQKHTDDEYVHDILPDVSHLEHSSTDVSGPSWREFRKALGGVSEDVRATDLNGRSLRLWSGTWWRMAACILLLAVAGGIWFLLPEVDSHSRAEALKEQAVETTTDEHRLIVLPDGSKVWINGGSKLMAAAGFNHQTRKVTLHGEAFFDIRTDPDRPFIIESGDVRTTVLGTAFNIRAFPHEGEVTVTVARGRVLVETDNRRAGMLTANQQIKLDLKSNHVRENRVDAEEVSQWIKDDLVLYEVTMDEAEEILEELYNKEIQFGNTRLKACRFTSTLTGGASLEEVLTAICMVNNATFTIDDNIINIYGAGCEAAPSDTFQ